jgi:beta-lactam-binding protein with PASTA domain
MRSFLRMTLLALVLVLVALVSALTAMRFAIHGREVTVPKLTGMAPTDARRVAADNGLLLVVENRFYSAEVPSGRIVSQLPQAGERVRRGWQVRVAESLGPQLRTIPNLVGQSERAAEINLRRRGLDVGSITAIPMPDKEPDDVVAQSPSPNAAAASPAVSLLVAAPASDAAYIMPTFVGRHLADAAKAINDAGLKLGTVNEIVGSATGVIVHQSPAPGAKVGPGTVVSFDVSK